jgi:hypothetical protein
MMREQPENLEEVIRVRAYELYENRGREDGHDLDDWLTAEQEVRNRKTQTTAA